MGDKEYPLVSIIVRTKDRPGLLGTALQSIASQDYRPIEVVLINDGGCDLDINIATDILRNCSLKYIRFEKSQGRAAAGNAGITAAQGKYIGFLDDDDEFYPAHISTLVVSLEESGARVVYADSEFVLKEVDAEMGFVDIKERRIFSSYDFSYVDLMSSNYIPLISLLFSGEFLKQSGGFDERFNLYEDWDLLLRIGEKFPFHHIRKVTSVYNQWNTGRQIAQSAAADVINNAFVQIFRNHRHNITPEVILNLNNKQQVLSKELKDLITKYLSVESELYKRYAELRGKDAELEQKRVELDQKNVELHQKGIELHQKGTELYQMASDLARKTAEAEGLQNENFHLRNALDAMKSTLGWQVLEKIRDMRDTMLPRGTKRGRMYQSIISFLKSKRRTS